MADHAATPATSTQATYPWRATARTAFAVIVAFAAMWPLIVTTAGLDSTAGVAASISVAAGITRVMALPSVDAFIRAFIPWLAPAPAVTAAPAAPAQNAG